MLLLAAGVEMDSAARRAVRERAHGAPQRRWATLRPGAGGAARAALERAHAGAAAAALAPASRSTKRAGLTAARLRIDERVLHYLAGVNYLDARLQPLLQAGRRAAAAWPTRSARWPRDVADALARQPRRPLPLVQLWRRRRAWPARRRGRRSRRAAGCTLYAHRAPTMSRRPRTSSRRSPRCGNAKRRCSDGALLVELRRCVRGAHGVRRFVEQVERPGVRRAARAAARSTRADLRYRVDKPTGATSGSSGSRRSAPSAAGSAAALDGVGAEFRLSAARSSRRAAARAAPHCGERPADGAAAAACRELGRPRLDGLAQRIEPQRRLGRPRAARGADCRRCARSPRRCGTGSTVLRALGLRRARARAGSGIAVLFAGESGTGKTHGRRGAGARARGSTSTASTSSAVVSKYIGETEKNLRARLRRGRGRRRDPALRRGRRAVRQAQRGEGQPRPLRQHRGQLPAAAHGGVPRPGDPDDQPEGRARHGVPAAAALRRAVSRSRTRPSAKRSGARVFPAATPTAGLDHGQARAAATSPAAASATSR